MSKDRGRVLMVGSLADFELEVPAPAVVRLNLTERNSQIKFGDGRQSYAIPSLIVNLDLQGINPQQEVVWLHMSRELQRTPDGAEFWRQDDKSIYELMPVMLERVQAYLLANGYEVRRGQYGTPRDIQMMAGIFECVIWRKSGDGYALEDAA